MTSIVNWRIFLNIKKTPDLFTNEKSIGVSQKFIIGCCTDETPMTDNFVKYSCEISYWNFLSNFCPLESCISKKPIGIEISKLIL